jgi:putative hemolysin
MNNNKDVLIDIEGVLKKKNPGLARVIPRFVVAYIKRVVHQDEINAFIATNVNKLGFDFVDAILEYFKVNTLSFFEERIPKNGRFIFVANHPLGALESLALMKIVKKYHPEMKFIVNDILMGLTNVQNLFLPVNKHGKSSMSYFKMMEEYLASDNQVLIFPAGLVSRRIHGKVQDLEWKKSFINMATKHQRDIVPVHINARNSNFFYRFAQIRKMLGIKANIEMIYLPDELYKQHNKTIRFTFGSLIPHTHFTKEKSPQEWATWVREQVYKLESDNNN